MYELLLFLLEWMGTALIIMGILFLSSKKASDPNIRIDGQTIVIVGCSVLGLYGFIVGSYGVMLTQIGVILTSFHGIRNCKKEIKEKTKGNE